MTRSRPGSTILSRGLARDSHLATAGEKRSGWVWASHEENALDGFHSYYQFVPKGKWLVEYTVRLNNEGEFLLPQTRVEAMYAPEMFGELPRSTGGCATVAIHHQNQRSILRPILSYVQISDGPDSWASDWIRSAIFLGLALPRHCHGGTQCTNIDSGVLGYRKLCHLDLAVLATKMARLRFRFDRFRLLTFTSARPSSPNRAFTI